MIVHIEHLTKVFQKDTLAVPVLEDINLDVNTGEFLALMGPSGSGKSTLLNIIAGIDKPTQAEVTVLGTSITQLSEDALAVWRNHHIGFIFQTFNLIPALSAFENIELPLLLIKLSKQERRQQIMTALRLVGLEDRAEYYPRQLSGGQEQRVAIARAIVTDPDLILADEPTGDLDAQSAHDVLTILAWLNENLHKTIIMVTHDPNAAKRATRIQYLAKGTLR